MSKQLKILIILLAVVVGLGGTLALSIYFIDKAEHEDYMASSIDLGDWKNLVNRETSELSSVIIHTTEEEYTLNMNPDTNYLVVEGFNSLPQNTSALGGLASSVCYINADETIVENPEDPSKYGFDDPQFIKITFTDNSTFTLEIGTNAPLGGQYVRVGGENTIYLMNEGLDDILVPKEKYIGLNLIESQTTSDTSSGSSSQSSSSQSSDTATTVKPENLIFSGSIRENPIEIMPNSNDDPSLGSASCNYLIPSYGYLPADNELMTSVNSSLVPFTADEAVIAHPTADQIEQYGLSNPRSIAEFSVLGQQYTIKLGNKEGGSYYLMVSGIDCIYAISDANAPWAELQAADLLASPVYAPEITAVSSISLQTSQSNHTFDITVTDLGSSQGIDNVLLDGIQYDTQQYRDIYEQFLNSNNTAETENSAPESSPALTVIMKFNCNDRTDTLDYYYDSATTCRLIINQTVNVTVPRDKVDIFIASINALNAQ